LPVFLLVTPKISPLSLEITLPGDYMVVVCKASVLSNFFDVKLNKPSEYPYQEFDLFKGFPVFETVKVLSGTIIDNE
jgi:hypothetical protein